MNFNIKNKGKLSNINDNKNNDFPPAPKLPTPVEYNADTCNVYAIHENNNIYDDEKYDTFADNNSTSNHHTSSSKFSNYSQKPIKTTRRFDHDQDNYITPVINTSTTTFNVPKPPSIAPSNYTEPIYNHGIIFRVPQ